MSENDSVTNDTATKSNAGEDGVHGSLNSDSLARVREGINTVDSQLLQLLAKRRAFSREMAEAKQNERFPIRDREREEALLVDRIRSGRVHGLDASLVTSIFHTVIEDSVRLQQQIFQRRANPGEGSPDVVRVAIQGVEGAYSHLAARQHFGRSGSDVVLVECKSFKDVTDSVEKGAADFGMLPVENTTSGGINPVHDVLLHARVAIVGEEKFKVEHMLAVKPGTKLEDVRKVFSHPEAVAQCQKFLSNLPSAQVEYYMDTAAAVKMVAETSEEGYAAIASEEATRLYGLEILARDIASQEKNFTRFLIASRKPRNVDTRIPTKTSLVMATGHEPGALLEALTIFRDRELNLTRLESRPILGNPWEEMFYVDFVGNIADPHVEEALDALADLTAFIKVLGSYPSEDMPPTELSPEARIESTRDTAGPAGERVAARVRDTSVAGGVSLDEATRRGFRRASRARKSGDTIVDVRGIPFGGDSFSVIAGPAFVRDQAQIRDCAKVVSEFGAQVLRAGARYRRLEEAADQTLPDNPVGLLAEAGRVNGLPTVTNVNSEGQLRDVVDDVDVLMVSARNMMNRELLQAVGRTHKPVLLKRGWMSSVDELLQAAELILAEGNRQVILCERGIRTFDQRSENTLDLTAIPILRSLTHLPVIVDPSRAAGRADLVAPLALAARAVGAHGVMLEVDTDDHNIEGLAEAMNFAQFEALMEKLVG